MSFNVLSNLEIYQICRNDPNFLKYCCKKSMINLPYLVFSQAPQDDNVELISDIFDNYCDYAHNCGDLYHHLDLCLTNSIKIRSYKCLMFLQRHGITIPKHIMWSCKLRQKSSIITIFSLFILFVVMLQIFYTLQV